MVELNSLKKPNIAPVVKPPPDELVIKVANCMIDHGYRFSDVTLKVLTDYLAGKALFLAGDVGTGKSFFFKALSEYINGYEKGTCRPIHPYQFAVIRTGLASTMTAEALRVFLLRHSDFDLVVDDLGTENQTSEYGSKYEVLEMIFQMRESAKGRTHFTTNLTEKMLLDRYGVRITDRAHTMGYYRFTGKSMRTADSPTMRLTCSDDYRVFGIWEKKKEN